MRKIPTIFLRDEVQRSRVTSEVNPICQWVFDGEGIATRKHDGLGVLIRRDGMAVHAYVRHAVKPGKDTPANFQEIERDPITGNVFGWVPGGTSSRASILAAALRDEAAIVPGTYELVGPKVNSNPVGYATHRLLKHGDIEVGGFPLTFDGIRDAVLTFAQQDAFEGLVWHHPDGRMGKIKSRDFGHST